MCLPNQWVCEETRPLADCISPAGGTDTCGAPWDSDNDTISTATETNSANSITFGGFYSFDTLKWDLNRSIASGEPGSGVLRNGMNLRDQGADAVGYVHYNGCDPIDTDDWGTGHLLRLMEASGRQWAPTIPRMQVGDLSLRLGGFFGDCAGVADHTFHQNGLDVDIRYLRFNGEQALNICTQQDLYDVNATVRLLNAIGIDNGNGVNGDAYVEFVFVDTACVGFQRPLPDWIRYAPGHQNHFHVRIRDPDGTSN